MAEKKDLFSKKTAWILFIVGIIIAIWPFISMQGLENELMVPEPHYGIVQYEFIFSVDKAKQIIDTWGDELVPKAEKSLWVDFIFIPGYALIFFSITYLFGLWHKGAIRRWGKCIAIFPFVAGLFDVIENTFLLLILKAPESIPGAYPLIASSSASVKFVLLLIPVIFWFVSIVAKVFVKKGD